MIIRSSEIFGGMFYEPTSAINAAKTGKGMLLPLMLLTLLPVLIYFWYFNTVDTVWLVDRMLASQPDLKPDELEVARTFMGNSLKWLTLGGVLVATPLTMALCGLYLFVFANRGGERLSYGKWFALAVWSNLPKLLLLPLMALQIVTSGGHVTIDDLNMASLNYLVFKLPVENPWAGLLSSIDLSTVWTLALIVNGVCAWTGRSLASAFVISSAPYFLIYGAWAAKIACVG